MLVKFGNPVYLVPEDFDPDDVIEVTGNDINRVPFYAKAPGHEFHIVSFKLDIDKFLKDFLSLDLISNLQFKPHLLEILRVAKPVDAGHGSHHNHVLARHQGSCSCKAHLFNLRVYLRIFLNVLVFGRKIGLGLVIVII